MLKVVCISDSHSQNLRTKWEWPDGDILVHAGDLTARGTEKSLIDVGRQLHDLPYRYKIIVAGNHDRGFWQDNKARNFVGYRDSWKFFPGIITLRDELIEIMGLKVYGASWIYYPPGLYPFVIEQPKQKWERIPDKVDVLLTHMPPWGIMDRDRDGDHIGSESLLRAVKDRIKPQLHVFGHMHRDYGVRLEPPTCFVNACLVDNDRRPNNKPIVIEVQND